MHLFLKKYYFISKLDTKIIDNLDKETIIIYRNYNSKLFDISHIISIRNYCKKKRIKFDGSIIEERTVVVDQTTFNATEAAYKYNATGISKYDHEIKLNDNKRDISLLDVKYLETVRDEVETILRNGV